MIDKHSVVGMIFLRTRQTPDNIHPVPSGSIPGQSADRTRVGIEILIASAAAAADSRIARSYIKHWIGKTPGHYDTGNLPGINRTHGSVVIVVGYLLNDVDHFRIDHIVVGSPVTLNGERVDQSVLLADIKPSVGTKLQGGGIVQIRTL